MVRSNDLCPLTFSSCCLFSVLLLRRKALSTHTSQQRIQNDLSAAKKKIPERSGPEVPGSRTTWVRLLLNISDRGFSFHCECSVLWGCRVLFKLRYFRFSTALLLGDTNPQTYSVKYLITASGGISQMQARWLWCHCRGFRHTALGLGFRVQLLWVIPEPQKSTLIPQGKVLIVGSLLRGEKIK